MFFVAIKYRTMSLNRYVYTEANLAEAWKSKSKSIQFAGLQKRGQKYYIGEKEVIPKEQVKDFLREYYDDPETGFVGRDRLFAKIYQGYIGVSKLAVQSFLSNSETAQVHQQPKIISASRVHVNTAPMKCWGIDLTFTKALDHDSVITVEKESQILLTVIDQFSKFAWVRLLTNKRAKTVVGALDAIMAAAGAPSIVKTDNGTEFTSGEFKSLCSKYKIKHILSETYSPTQNAIIERFNRSIKMAIYKYQTQYRARLIDADALQKLVSNYNQCQHGTTKQVPATVHVVGDKKIIAATRHQIKQRAEKIVAENTRNFPELKVGSTVRIARRTDGSWRKSRMLSKRGYLVNWFQELYKVSSWTRASPTKASLYTLIGPDGKLIARQFLRHDLLLVDRKQLITDLERGEYVVEAVLGKKVIDGRVKYLCKFVGYRTPEWTSPQKSFQRLIDAYEKAQAKK
jgi:hypothetical protein